MLKSNFDSLLNFSRDKNILITTHNLVDIDGLASCFVFKFILNQLIDKPLISLWFSELTKASKEYMSKFMEKFPDFNFNHKKEIEFSNFELIFILDTNNLTQLEFPDNIDLNEQKIPFIFIDHHLDLKKEYPENESSLNLIIKNYSSTAEILFDICEAYDLLLPLPYKILLTSAILTDSGFFKYGNNNSIIRVSKLLDSNIKFQEILLLLKIEKEIPERVAKIKGIQRVKIIRHGNWLIGVTNVSSYESSVATSLVEIGFDIGIVFSDKKSEFRISTRAKKKICLKTGLHLGRILEELSDESISGGGHDGAASLTGKKGQEDVIEKIIDKVKLSLNEKKLI